MNSRSIAQPSACVRLPGRGLWLTVALLNLLLTGCGVDRPTGSTERPSATSVAPADHTATPAPASLYTASEQIIHIDNFTYAPAEVTVKAGTKVTWINRDDVPHTATSTATPRRFDSKALDTDQQYSFVFDQPGTYEYFCAVHPKMTGRVIVK